MKKNFYLFIVPMCKRPYYGKKENTDPFNFIHIDYFNMFFIMLNRTFSMSDNWLKTVLTDQTNPQLMHKLWDLPIQIRDAKK